MNQSSPVRTMAVIQLCLRPEFAVVKLALTIPESSIDRPPSVPARIRDPSAASAYT